MKGWEEFHGAVSTAVLLWLVQLHLVASWAFLWTMWNKTLTELESGWGHCMASASLSLEHLLSSGGGKHKGSSTLGGRWGCAGAMHVKCFDFQGRQMYPCARVGSPGTEQSLLDGHGPLAHLSWVLWMAFKRLVGGVEFLALQWVHVL